MGEGEVEIRELRQADVEPALALLRDAGETVEAKAVSTALSLLMVRNGEPCAAAVLVEEDGRDRLLLAARPSEADDEASHDLEALIDKALMKIAALRRRRLSIRVLGDPSHNPLARADFLRTIGRGQAA